MAVKQALKRLDATDVRDLIVISLFVATLLVWAAIGAGA
jgi:hypothetical protein